MKRFLTFFAILISFTSFSQEQFTIAEVQINPLLTGTLYTPKKPNKSLVILISGSGIPDRDGNQEGAKNNSLKFLAEGLASKNNAVYSFDKRTIAQIKSGNIEEEDVSFDHLITDVKDIVSYFKAQKKYSKIVIAGHSEGSLIGMIAGNGMTDSFISLAGSGRRIDEVIVEQIGKQAPFLKEETQKNFDTLKAGKTFELKNAMLASLFRPSVQPYLISWLRYNPQEEIKKLNIPVLVINGTKDIQIPVTDAELLHLANPKSELVIIENMNHIFKEIKEDSKNMASYNDTTLPVMPELIEKMSAFINKN